MTDYHEYIRLRKVISGYHWILLGLLIAALIADTITDGIETGQRGGKIYPDNTPPLGPHHWNLQAVKGYQNSKLIKQVSVACFPTQMFVWNWCAW